MPTPGTVTAKCSGLRHIEYSEPKPGEKRTTDHDTPKTVEQVKVQNGTLDNLGCVE